MWRGVLKGTCGPLAGDTPRIGTKGQIGSQETRDEAWARSLKDDINKETTAAGSTHGPLGLQRLPDLTNGSEVNECIDSTMGRIHVCFLYCLLVTIRELVGSFMKLTDVDFLRGW